MMKIIVGLGNPLKKYQSTPHNLGFFVLENYQKKANFSPWEKKEKLLGELSFKEEVILFKPLTFMNQSGKAVKKILKFFKVPSQNLLIIHDDADLALSCYKLQFGRGSAGHLGVASIIKALKTKNFWRLRIGIRPAKEEKRKKAGELVLKKFSPEELEIIKKILPQIFQKIDLWQSGRCE